MGYEENGLMGEVLERMYREQFQENLPDNWVQLLEVYSYFTFDKITNKIIIYLVIIFFLNNNYNKRNCCEKHVCIFLFRMISKTTILMTMPLQMDILKLP